MMRMANSVSAGLQTAHLGAASPGSTVSLHCLLRPIYSNTKRDLNQFGERHKELVISNSVLFTDRSTGKFPFIKGDNSQVPLTWVTFMEIRSRLSLPDNLTVTHIK